MNKYVKGLYRFANSYGPGGPKKKSNEQSKTNTVPQFQIDFHTELEREMNNRSYAQVDNVRTPNLVAQAETKVQADKNEKKAQEEELRRKTQAEIKPQNPNPMNYASTNPQSQQMAETARLNELNPQTVYRPDMYYQGQYFSPETREQAKRDMWQYSMLPLAAADPPFAAYLLTAGSNELFNDNPYSKDFIGSALAWAPFGGMKPKQWVTNKFNNTKKKLGTWLLEHTDDAAKTVENEIKQNTANTSQEALNRYLQNTGQADQIAHDVVFGDWLGTKPEDSFNWWKFTVGRNSRMPYRLTREAKTAEDVARIQGHSRFFGNMGRGSFYSDVFVPKNMIDGQKFSLIVGAKDGKPVLQNIEPKGLFENVHFATPSFKNSVGVNAKPSDYYRVNLNHLMQTRSNAFKNPELRAILQPQMQQTAYDAAKNAARMPIYYNPNTIRFGAFSQFWPVGYGNVAAGRPWWSKARQVANSSLNEGLFWGLGVPKIVHYTITEPNQSNEFLHSGDYDAEDRRGMEWYTQSPSLNDEDRATLDNVLSNYRLYFNTADSATQQDLQFKLDFITDFYHQLSPEDSAGFDAYRRRYLER